MVRHDHMKGKGMDIDISRVLAWLLTIWTIGAFVWLGLEAFAVNAALREPRKVQDTTNVVRVVLISGGAIIGVLLVSAILAIFRLANPANPVLNLWSYVAGQSLLLIVVVAVAFNIHGWRKLIASPKTEATHEHPTL